MGTALGLPEKSLSCLILCRWCHCVRVVRLVNQKSLSANFNCLDASRSFQLLPTIESLEGLVSQLFVLKHLVVVEEVFRLLRIELALEDRDFVC